MVTEYWEEVAEKVGDFTRNLAKRTMELPTWKRRAKRRQRQQNVHDARRVAGVTEGL